VQSLGGANSTPAAITGTGTVALNTFNDAANATRTFTVADAVPGNNSLIINAAIVDGTSTALITTGTSTTVGVNPPGSIVKTGLGAMEFQGNTANTYTGTTTVSVGTLNLNKTVPLTATTTGTAMGGALVIGDGSISGNSASGLQKSDVVKLKQPNQLPDFG